MSCNGNDNNGSGKPPRRIGSAIIELPPAGSYPCRGTGTPCPAAARLERPGVCEACGKVLLRQSRLEVVREAVATVPPLYAKLRPNDERVRSVVPAGDLQKAMKATGWTQMTILGAAGAGKTTLAVVLLLRAIRAGVVGTEAELAVARSSRFIPARDIAEYEAAAKAASLLVIDDLGAELASGPGGTPLAAMRAGPLMNVLSHRHELGKPTIVTCGMSTVILADTYGGGLMRRLTEKPEGCPGRVLVFDLTKQRPTDPRPTERAA